MFILKLQLKSKTKSYKSETPEYVIGRAAECNIVIASDVISRKHLKVIISKQSLQIVDLKSANGTFINGAQIESSKAYEIGPNDRVKLGNMTEEISFSFEQTKANPYEPVPANNYDQFTIDNYEIEEVSRIAPPVPEPPKSPKAPTIPPKPPTSYSSKTPPSIPPYKGSAGVVKVEPLSVSPSIKPLKLEVKPPLAAQEDVLELAEKTLDRQVSTFKSSNFKSDEIIENAKKKARLIVVQAEEEAKQLRFKSMNTAESIIADANQQAIKVAENAEEAADLIVKQAKIDATNITEKAQMQGRQIVDKSTHESDIIISEAKRQKESLIKNELLEIEKLKIKMQDELLVRSKKELDEFNTHKKTEMDKFETYRAEEIKQLTAFKEEELSKLKEHIFSEKDKVRKENDKRKSEFVKELIEKERQLSLKEALVMEKIQAEENKINDLVLKNEELKKYSTQDSLKLKMEHDEEKKKLELEFLQLKKKYDIEIEDYKRREFDTIKKMKALEEQGILEKKKLQTMEMGFSLKKDIAHVLDLQLKRSLSQEELNSLINRISETIDFQSEAISEKASKEAETPVVIYDNESDEKSSSKLRYIGITAGFILVFTFIFWDTIYSSVKSSDSYASFMFRKMQADSVYVPVQTTQWRNSYHERVLFLQGYVEFKSTQLYMDKWTQYLTNIENARQLQLAEDDMIRFIAREVNLINQLSNLQKTIDARQLDLGLAKLKNAEDEAIADFIKILKSRENLDKILMWEKKFVADYEDRIHPKVRQPSEI